MSFESLLDKEDRDYERRQRLQAQEAPRPPLSPEEIKAIMERSWAPKPKQPRRRRSTR